MSKTIMGAAVSLDGFIADDHDGVGPLFDWYGNGEVGWSLSGDGDECRTTQQTADFMLAQYPDIAVVVIGRRLFDLMNGWNGVPAAGEHVVVVTHQPPVDWEHVGTAPFAFVDGVEAAIGAARDRAGDRIVDVAGGEIGGQALRLGLIDRVVVNLVPVVFGSGRPFFATGPLGAPLVCRQRGTAPTDRAGAGSAVTRTKRPARRASCSRWCRSGGPVSARSGAREPTVRAAPRGRGQRTARP